MGIVVRILKSRTFYALVLAVATVVAAFVVFDGISRQADANQVEFLQNAIRRSAVQCYALEGRFPEDVRYLEENYALIIDRTRYNVYYESMGGNLTPQIRVSIIER
ncbi:MAG: hypothetical protein LBG71_08165 [Clostridiales Family XIII bacterium]|jgi:hypothetical protein|nr:hypothetical protein [Clostridiales Family XIII bacterium]